MHVGLKAAHKEAVMEQLILYYKETCPYSQKVLRFLQETPLKIYCKDISKDLSAAEELLQVGGKMQVPCLSINGKALYESDDIIQWLKNMAGNKG
jgi:glutaredoxin